MKTRFKHLGVFLTMALLVFGILSLTACSNPAGGGSCAHNFVGGTVTPFDGTATTITFTGAACSLCGASGTRTVTPDVIIDLAEGTGVINITTGQAALIKGVSNGDRRVVFSGANAAREIYIANGTTLSLTGQGGINFVANSTIYGGGPDITINFNGTSSAIICSGNLTISGTIGNISHSSPAYGIYTTGNLLISGTIGNITISNTSGLHAPDGIYTTGSVTISGTTGTISGANATGTGNYNGGNGIRANGGVTISGSTGTISGGARVGTGDGGSGIRVNAGSTVTITGTASIGNNTASSITGAANGGAKIRIGDELHDDWNGTRPYTRP